MDPIVSSVLAAQQNSLSDQVSFTVLRKAMDSQKQEGDQVVQLLQQAAAVQSQPTDSGRVDLYA